MAGTHLPYFRSFSRLLHLKRSVRSTQNIIQIERTIYRYDRWKGNPLPPGETAGCDLLEGHRPADLRDVPRHPLPADGGGDGRPGIQDAVLLVVGTDECAYYTKHMTIHSDDFGGLQGRCVSAVLDTRDVTFGCKAKLDEAVAELVAEYSPKAVFIVTTLRRRDHRGRRRRLCRQLLGAVRHPVYGGPHRAL